MHESIKNLTWDDLRAWAGSTILNRGKSYLKNIHDLVTLDNGGLAAWVSGAKEYATCVEVGEGEELEYFCSCPYDLGPCKHAVAVVLAGIEQAKAGREIPLIDKEGDLYLTLQAGPDDDEDFPEEDDSAGEDAEPEPVVKAKSGERQPLLAGILRKKSREELVALLVDLAGRHPAVKRKILEEEQLQCGGIDKLANALRKEIRQVTGEPA